MNLPFQTIWQKKVMGPTGVPTRFITKIQRGLIDQNLATPVELVNLYQEFYQSERTKNGVEYSPTIAGMPPKLHTIRQGNRWKAGDKIHFCINNRTKNYHRFAPILAVKSVQEIWISHKADEGINVHIDGVFFHYDNSWLSQDGLAMTRLAINDGFENIDQFFRWFDSDFEGQIIHWTDLRY